MQDHHQSIKEAELKNSMKKEIFMNKLLDDFTPHQCHINLVQNKNETIINIVKDEAVKLFDEPTYAYVNNLKMTNGIIEVDVLSTLKQDAPDFARGFIGVAFRINDAHSHFESVYLRPTNGRANDEQRSIRAVQYFVYPNYKFDYLREHHQTEFESAADIGLDEWIHMKVIIENNVVTLYLNHQDQPTLVVEQSFISPSHGYVALWCDVGTDAYFKNLQVTVL